MLQEWRELLGGYAPAVWAIVAFLGTISIFLPFWLYTDARRRGSRPLLWSGVSVAVPVVGIPLGLLVPGLSGFFPLWALGLLVIPVGTLVAYLIFRAAAKTCPECGMAMRPEWRFCPRHKAMQPMGAAPSAPAPAHLDWGGDDVGVASPVRSGTAVPGRGQVAAASPVANAIGMLLVREGADRGRQFPVGAGGLVVGRDPGVGAHLSDPSASSSHAQVAVQDGRAQIIDLGSSNGTYVNDEPIDRAFLYDGDAVRIGDTTLVYKELR